MKICKLLFFGIWDGKFFFSFSFKSHKDPLAIEYKKFCVEIESIFANDQLEKNPLIDAKQYALERSINQNYLTADAENTVMNSLNKISERVCLWDG